MLPTGIVLVYTALHRIAGQVCCIDLGSPRSTCRYAVYLYLLQHKLEDSLHNFSRLDLHMVVYDFGILSAYRYIYLCCSEHCGVQTQCLEVSLQCNAELGSAAFGDVFAADALFYCQHSSIVLAPAPAYIRRSSQSSHSPQIVELCIHATYKYSPVDVS